MLTLFLRSLAALLLASATSFAFTQAPTSKEKTERQALVGFWYGEDYQPTNGKVTKWLMERRADGTFTISFKATPLQHVSDETGTWTRKGLIYSTRTMSVGGAPTDPDDPFYYDDYRLEEVEFGRITYLHLREKVRFRSVRVDHGFRIP